MNKRIFFSHPEKNKAEQKQQMPQETTAVTNKAEPTEQPKSKSDNMNGPVIRTTIDIPKKMHKVVKQLLLEEDLTFKAYVIALIHQDFKSRGKEL